MEHTRDFDVPETAKQAKVQRIRVANERRIEGQRRKQEEQERIRKQREAEAERLRKEHEAEQQKKRHQAQAELKRLIREKQEAMEQARQERIAELEAEYQRIYDSFDEHSETPTIDKFAHRKKGTLPFCFEFIRTGMNTFLWLIYSTLWLDFCAIFQIYSLIENKLCAKTVCAIMKVSCKRVKGDDG